ncbi:MAG: hypothetical protein RIG82_01195 [Phycisphaeraceae bacterium]
MKPLTTAAYLALLITPVATAGGATVDFAATGVNDAANDDFFQINFTTGNPSDFIAQIVYTLPGGTFDLDGFAAPYLGTLSGLLSTDITFSPTLGSATSTSSLTLTFAPGSFAVGDTLAFGIDIDGYGSPIDGSALSTNNALVTLTLEDTLSASDTFTLDPNNADTALASIFIQTVPTPAAAVSGLTLLALLTARRR